MSDTPTEPETTPSDDQPAAGDVEINVNEPGSGESTPDGGGDGD